jgi:hypothetical protein
MAWIVVAIAGSPGGIPFPPAVATRSPVERAQLESAFALVRHHLGEAVEEAREEPA